MSATLPVTEDLTFNGTQHTVSLPTDAVRIHWFLFSTDAFQIRYSVVFASSDAVYGVTLPSERFVTALGCSGSGVPERQLALD